MPGLAGFTAAAVIRKLRRAGFVFDRQAKGSHEIWWNPSARARTTVPNHPATCRRARCAPSSARRGFLWRSFWSFRGAGLLPLRRPMERGEV